MMSVGLALALQLSVVAAPNPVTDEALTAFALQESPIRGWLSDSIAYDPAMRAEIRRVGFHNGCNAMAESSRSVAARYRGAFVPLFIKNIRSIVPADQLEQMKILSFFVGPMQIYKGRVYDGIRADSSEILAEAQAEMRNAFLARTSVLATADNGTANAVTPKADVAAALGLGEHYDLDNPAHILFACAEQRIAPEQRPMIKTGQ